MAPSARTLTLCKERAYRQAARIDELADKGNALPPLAGVPIAIKDVFTTQDVRTTAGSKILENFIAPYDATVVQRSWKKREPSSWARPIATSSPWARRTKIQAFIRYTIRAIFRACREARREDRLQSLPRERRSPRMGSDTGGSIRQPAAFCGVVGLMPTYGRVSRYGLIAFASSLDHPGPFGKTVKDVALLLQVMAGRDPLDSTTAEVPVPNYLRPDRPAGRQA